MPIMNGEIAAKEMRALQFPGIIIGVTGNGLPADIASFKHCGANDVIVKPMSIEKFESVMTQLTKKQKRGPICSPPNNEPGNTPWSN